MEENIAIFTIQCGIFLAMVVDIRGKLEQIKRMIYFTINRPRQYGKTTTMFLLKRFSQNEYLVIRTSFEGLGETFFAQEEAFSYRILGLFARGLEHSYPEYARALEELGRNVHHLEELSGAITRFIAQTGEKVVLMIDEGPWNIAVDFKIDLSFSGGDRHNVLEYGEDQ